MKFQLFVFLITFVCETHGKIVLIDPGHGGMEKGAIGKNIKFGKIEKKLFEKDICFMMAKKVQEKLSKKHQVYLTRSYDKTLSLEERAGLAQKIGADLFVSIHANSSESAKSHGFETYYLDNNDNEAVKKVVRLENNDHTSKLESNYSDNPMIHQILSELVVGKTVPLSRKLGDSIHQSVKRTIEKKHSMKDRGLKPGLFFVLAMSKVPGVLLEMGFISNQSEARKIHSEKFIDDYSSAVSSGIDDFLSQNL